MKLVVIALLESFGGIANVVIVIVLCWIMISILGINFVRNKMGYCSGQSIDNIYNVNQNQCLSEKQNRWKTYPWNMDNIVSSMLTIFVFATLEGWNDLVYTYLDSNEAQYGPIYENRFWILSFNLILIYLCAFFFVDLFVGVIFLNYVLAEEKVKNKNISSDQVRWIKIQKQILSTKPDYYAFKTPDNKYQLFFYKVVRHKNYFDNLIMLVIIANIVVMCMTYDGEPPYYT